MGYKEIERDNASADVRKCWNRTQSESPGLEGVAGRIDVSKGLSVGSHIHEDSAKARRGKAG